MYSKVQTPLTSAQTDAAVRDLCGNDCRVTFSTPLGGGLFNSSVYVETENPKAKLVLRAAPVDKSILFGYEKTMIGAEEYFQGLMMSAGVPTTRILVTRGAEVMGRAYNIVEFTPSQPLNSPMLNDVDKTSLYGQLGKYTRRIHDIIAPKFGWNHPDAPELSFDKWSLCIANYLETGAAACSSIGTLEDGVCEKLTRVAPKFETLLDTVAEPKMNHCDLWEPNVLVRKIGGQWQITAIIDADRAIFGDTEFEFAVQWVMNDAFLQGYGRGFDNSPDTVVKRKIYALCYSAFACFTYRAAFNDENSLMWHKERLIKTLGELGV